MYNTLFNMTSSLERYFNETPVHGEVDWRGPAFFLAMVAAIGIPLYFYGLIRNRIRK